MRNRVSFSYIDKYNDSYSTYSNTIFFAHEEKSPKIYKGGVKYTYIGGKNWTYIHHDLGTSYINTDEKAILYENEYDRYKYVIGEVDNNKKEISYTLYNNDIQIEESIHTYINVPKNSYTYFPNVITGLTGKKYDIYKYAYAYSTNGMLAYGFTYDATDNSYYGKHISNNDYDITYDIRGTYTLTNSEHIEHIRIQGIGFSVGSKDIAMYAGVEYDNILTIKVYGFNKENPSSPIHLKNEDLYNSLNVEFPGINENTIEEITRTPESVTVKLKDSNQHIGTILAKISLDWKNNKFTLYHQFTFAGIINEIDKINEFYYNVNGNTEHHTQLLEGDYITYSYVSTIPERANNTIKLELDTNPASYLNSYYDGTCEKTYNSSADYWYVVEKNVKSLNSNSAEMQAYITYNIIDGVNKNDCTVYTYIYRFVPSDIDFTYIDDNEILHTFTDPEDNDLAEMSNNINCYMNIAYKDNLSHYHHKLNRLNSNEQNSSYNLFDIKCKYVINDTSENEVPLTSSEIIYNENSANQSKSYTSYHFTYNVIEPGKYIFSYISKNGLVKHEAEIGTYSFKQINKDNIYIITYEGATNIKLLNDEITYKLYDNNIISNDNIDLYNFNNVDYDYVYAYFGICKFDNATANIGIFKKSDNFIKDTKDIDDIYIRISNFMLGHSNETKNDIIADISKYYQAIRGKNYDEPLDISSINDIINVRVKSDLISPYKYDDNDTNYRYWGLSSYNTNNNYIINNHEYYIRICPISVINTLSYLSNSNNSINIYDKINDLNYNNTWETEVIYDNQTYLNISKWAIDNNSYTYLKIDETLFSLFMDDDNETYISNRNNFNISLYENSVNIIDENNENDLIDFNAIENVSYVYEYKPNDVLGTLKLGFNKLKFKDIVNTYGNKTNKSLTVSFITKLNRNSVGDFNIDYWDALGFKDRKRNYKITMYYSTELINDLNIPDEIILFTNVCNNDTEHSKSYEYKTSDIEITNLQDIEKIQIISEDNRNYIVEQISDNKYGYNVFKRNNENDENNKLLLKIEHILDETDNKQYLEFTPLITQLEDVNDIKIKLKATIQNNDIKKSFTVRLIELSMEMSVDKLHYIRDINVPNNSDKILYEELLLSSNANGNISSIDNIWIKTFCGQAMNEDEKILQGYDLDEAGVILFIINSTNTNVPNGIKLLFGESNMKYYKDKRVLLPTKINGDAYYTLYNEDGYSQTFNMDMTESSINNTANLFTNGKKEYYKNS